MTLREYTWLDDLPVAVVDAVATSLVIYYVHTDHLFRPATMTDASQSIAWSATYTLFGAVQTIATPATNLNMRFPGQWFQLETGLQEMKNFSTQQLCASEQFAHDRVRAIAQGRETDAEAQPLAAMTPSLTKPCVRYRRIAVFSAWPPRTGEQRKLIQK